MNNSDIIALVAVVTGTIISVTSTLVSFFTNKTNIQARRSEIAFEKRLEAFREIVEHTGNIKILLLERDKDSINGLKDRLEKAIDDFYAVYRKNLVFLPPDISNKVATYGSKVYKVVHYHYSYESINKFYVESKEIERQIIEDMQKFVGYI